MMDSVPGYSIVNGLGKGAFCRVYEVKPEGEVGSFVLKIFSGQHSSMCARERFVLLRLSENGVGNVPTLIKHQTELVRSILIVTPVGIPIINAAVNQRITVSMILTLLEVIHSAHRLEIIHRDIKPENILIDSKDPQRLILNDWSSSVIGNEPTSYQGTPFYGEEHVFGRLQYPHKRLDYHCLIKTIFIIKQQGFPFYSSVWDEIKSYWNLVKLDYPAIRQLLTIAENENENEIYAHLHKSFQDIWF